MAEDRSHLKPVVAAGVDDDTQRWMLDLEFPLHGGLNGLAAALGRPIRSDDYLVDPRIPHETEDQYVAARLGIRGLATVPLRAPAGEIVGTLAVSFRTVHEVDDESLGLLQVLGDQAAVAVSNARLDALLRQSESRYRHLVENSPDLVWSIDEHGRFTFLSDTCERLTGWKPEELLGGHFGGLVHPSSREVAEIDWVDGLTDGNNEIRGRVNLLHSDGHPVPAEFIAVSRVVGGVFMGANGSVRDMSERDRLERELRSSEERYRFLVETSPDGVWQADQNGNFTFWSERATALFGWPAGAVVGGPYLEVVDPSSHQEADDTWAQLVHGEEDLVRARLLLRHLDGSTISAEVSGVAIQRDGQFAGAQGTVRDLRERERLETDLRRQAGELAARDERAHLARELHDSVTQALFSMTLITRTIELLLTKDPVAAKERLETLRDLQRDALAEMRALIFELRPGGLEVDGLVAALRRRPRPSRAGSACRSSWKPISTSASRTRSRTASTGSARRRSTTS